MSHNHCFSLSTPSMLFLVKKLFPTGRLNRKRNSVYIRFSIADHCPAGSEWDSGTGGCVACPVEYFRSVSSGHVSPTCSLCPQQSFTTMTTGSKKKLLCSVKRGGPSPTIVAFGETCVNCSFSVKNYNMQHWWILENKSE